MPEPQSTSLVSLWITALASLAIGIALGAGMSIVIEKPPVEVELLREQLVETTADLQQKSELLAKAKRSHKTVGKSKAVDQQTTFPQSISSSLWDVGFDLRLFRLCGRIPYDLDAHNLFLWAQRELFEFRDSEDYHQPMRRRKWVLHYMATLSTDGQEVNFRIDPWE